MAGQCNSEALKGRDTASELEELGVRVDVMPKVSAMGAMLNALATHVKKGLEIRE